MKRAAYIAILSILIPACDTVIPALLSAPVARHTLPLRTSLLCSPLFRSADIETIIVSIDAAKTEGDTKATAIINADEACSDAAGNLLTIGEDENADFDFDALDASAFESDCRNCYIALIDDIYAR